MKGRVGGVRYPGANPANSITKCPDSGSDIL